MSRVHRTGRRLGVDAGGTGCRAVVVSEGVVVDRLEAGPLNVLLHADGVDRLARLITETGVGAAGLGLAGVRSDEDSTRVAGALRDRTGVPVAVGDDTAAALAGAFRGEPGIVVISGTGCGAAGVSATGERLRVGGHGFLLGDEGGGYWIGREAMRAALRAGDGTGPATRLGDLLATAFGDAAGVERQVYARPTERDLLARLVPEVTVLAEDGDAEATRVLREAADHLAELAEAVRARLGDLPVAMVGGVFRSAPVRRRFVARTAAVDPAEPPELGALRLLDRVPTR